ncbi:hypothetical protein GALMADRAFT_251592 [Galerina marginata CBS 339.88]|uniref:Uncharacterized protein n=1 Tax=Galerina marginata (strain CBS 339.88) TaxID=685588 RepID=A0A067SS45_GALM3|nr:hypothetical protein GALMADRAFT_251592 [Galerina marginata CBS 339.88]
MEGAKRHKRKKTGQSKLKPVPPKTYHGQENYKQFHQFLTDGLAYVTDGQVPREKQVYVLSRYLDGKARDFYVQEVAVNPGFQV